MATTSAELDRVNWLLALVGKRAWLRSVALSKEFGLFSFTKDEEYQKILDEMAQLAKVRDTLQKELVQEQLCQN